MESLTISENRRYLVTEQGKPFFWLGATAWWLVESFERERVDRYFDDSRENGFTLIHAGVHRCFHGMQAPEKNVFNQAKAMIGYWSSKTR